MVSFDNNKLIGNDGLTKEFYQIFWQDVKDIFFNSLRKSQRLKCMCTCIHYNVKQLLNHSKNQTKKNDIFLIGDLSLCWTWMKKIYLKYLIFLKFKKVFPVLISPCQSAHFYERFIFIGEWRRGSFYSCIGNIFHSN